MMQIKVTAPAKIHTTIQLPSSKSISNRALIINALGNGTHHPENLSDCDDTRVMIRALNDDKETIDIMAAGTAMRFLTAYLSVTPGTRIITGTEFTHKLGYVETGFIISHSCIIRNQEIQETIAYLIIGKTQSVQ